MRPWIGSLALLLISCSSSTTKTTTTVGTTAVQEDPAYVDFAPQASTDGQKQVFLSRRDAGAFRVYLYNEAADPKLAALAKTIAVESGVDELATSLSDDGAWILTWRFGGDKNYLLLNSFDATQQQTWTLDADTRVRELALAPSAQHFFAYTSRKAGADTVHIYSFTPGALASATEEAAIAGEYGTQFAVAGSDVYAFTRKVSAAGQVTLQYRKRSGSGSWDLQTGTLSLNTADAAAPSAASAVGLLYAKTLDTALLKAKLGTFVPTVDGYQKNVGVVQEAQQFQAFAGSALNFTSAIYRQNQPLTLGNVSTTADGAYLLITGYDAWFCKVRTISQNFMLLVRTSDGASLPLLPIRDNATLPWTGLVSEPCSYFDQDPIPQIKDFDATVSNGQILSVSGNHVTLIYESKATIDREIRRLVFDVSDWTAKTYANTTFTNISNNAR